MPHNEHRLIRRLTVDDMRAMGCPAPEVCMIHEQRLTEGDRRMHSIESTLQVNTNAVAQIAENTRGLIAFSHDLESSGRFVGRLVKPATYLLKGVDKYWRPALVVFVVIALMRNDLKV